MNTKTISLTSGLTLLAISPLSQANFISSDLNIDINSGGHIYVDINGDSVMDFDFYHNDYYNQTYNYGYSYSTYRRSANTRTTEQQYTSLSALNNFSFLADPLLAGDSFGLDDNFVSFSDLARYDLDAQSSYTSQSGYPRRSCNRWGRNCRSYTVWGSVITHAGFTNESQSGSFMDDILANNNEYTGYIGFKHSNNEGNDYLGWLNVTLNNRGEGSINSFGYSQDNSLTYLNAGQVPIQIPKTNNQSNVSSPAVLGLMALGLGGLALARRRKLKV